MYRRSAMANELFDLPIKLTIVNAILNVGSIGTW